MNKQLTLDEKIRAIRSALRNEPARLKYFNSEVRRLRNHKNPFYLNDYVVCTETRMIIKKPGL